MSDLLQRTLIELSSKKANAEQTVGEKVDSWRRTGRMFLGVPREPLQGVVNRTDFLSVVGGTGGPYPVELGGVSGDGSPQRGLRGVGAVSKHSLLCRPRGEGSLSIPAYICQITILYAPLYIGGLKFLLYRIGVE